MFNWKDIRQISKSQKVKSQKVYFSTFRFFEIQNEAFLLFNFSTFRNWKWHRFTFWLFDFLTFPNWQWSLFTFQLSTWIFVWLVRLLVFPPQNCRLPLQWKNTCSEKKTRPAKKTRVKKWKNVSTQTHVMLESQIHPNTKYIFNHVIYI